MPARQCWSPSTRSGGDCLEELGDGHGYALWTGTRTPFLTDRQGGDAPVHNNGGPRMHSLRGLCAVQHGQKTLVPGDHEGAATNATPPALRLGWLD